MSIREKLFSGGDTTLRRGVTANFVVLVLVVVGAVGTVVLWSGYRAIDRVSQEAIAQASESVEMQLAGIFDPVEVKGVVIQDWGEAGVLTLGREEVEALNGRLRPMVERHKQLSAVSLADGEGREYVAWQEGQTWVSRYSYGDSADRKMSVWERWDENGELLESWEAEREEDSRARPWYVGAMASAPGQAYWTEPFEFFMSGEPGITMSRRFVDPSDGEPKVLALGVALEDISLFTTQMRPTENGFTVVMTPTGEVVGLPALGRYEDPEVVRNEVLSSWSELGLEAVGAAWKQWRDAEDRQAAITGNADEFGRYRAGFNSFELGDRRLMTGTVVPRKDLTGAVDRQRNMVIGFSLLALLLAGFLGRRVTGRFQDRIEEVYEEAQELGKYDLQWKLGVGGMGEVYHATHGMLKRPTAVKLLKPELYNETSIKRFEREVQLSCQLTHPNTVTIFDYGRTDDGLFYYAMELLEGVTLWEFVDYHGALPSGRVVYLMRQVCGALIEAHEIGLIHRDIKPGNIMVGYSAGLGDRVTVLDFGLVKDFKAPGGDTKLTNQEYLQGSPGYMAPEVIRGDSADDPTIDIYAVGAVMYFLLCGEEPFDGDSPVDVLMNQVEETPPPPSEVADGDVDAELEALTMRCMARDSEDRPASMEAVRSALSESAAARAWTGRDSIEWWTAYGDEVVPKRKPSPSQDVADAYGDTMSIKTTASFRSTLDSSPQVLIDADEQGATEEG